MYVVFAGVTGLRASRWVSVSDGENVQRLKGLYQEVLNLQIKDPKDMTDMETLQTRLEKTQELIDEMTYFAKHGEARKMKPGVETKPASTDTAAPPEDQPPVATAEGHPPAPEISPVPPPAVQPPPPKNKPGIKTEAPEEPEKPAKTTTPEVKPPVKPNPEKQQAAKGSASVKEKAAALFGNSNPDETTYKPSVRQAELDKLRQSRKGNSPMQDMIQKLNNTLNKS